MHWGVSPFAFRYQGNGATPCQCIDTTRKAIACATTLLLTVFMVALWNRTDHYIFILFLSSSFFFFISSPNLSGQRLDVYHTSTHGVALVRI